MWGMRGPLCQAEAYSTASSCVPSEPSWSQVPNELKEQTDHVYPGGAFGSAGVWLLIVYSQSPLSKVAKD